MPFLLWGYVHLPLCFFNLMLRATSVSPHPHFMNPHMQQESVELRAVLFKLCSFTKGQMPTLDA